MARTRLTTRWRLAVALMAALGLTACANAVGSSFVLTPAPPGTETPTLGTDRATSPLAPVLPAPAAPASAFCRDVAQLNAGLPTLLRPNQPSALTQAKAVVDRLPKDAPADIRPVATTLSQALNRIVADLGATPPNLPDLGPAIFRFQVSVRQVLAYASSHC